MHRWCLHHLRESDSSMLPGATVPRSLANLVAVFRPCFTAPTIPTFVGLLVGLIAQTRAERCVECSLTIAVDDTLFKRSGKTVFGAAWHHDGAAKGPKPIGFGNW